MRLHYRAFFHVKVWFKMSRQDSYKFFNQGKISKMFPGCASPFGKQRIKELHVCCLQYTKAEYVIWPFPLTNHICQTFSIIKFCSCFSLCKFVFLFHEPEFNFFWYYPYSTMLATSATKFVITKKGHTTIIREFNINWQILVLSRWIWQT